MAVKDRVTISKNDNAVVFEQTEGAELSSYRDREKIAREANEKGPILNQPTKAFEYEAHNPQRGQCYYSTPPLGKQGGFFNVNESYEQETGANPVRP